MPATAPFDAPHRPGEFFSLVVPSALENTLQIGAMAGINTTTREFVKAADAATQAVAGRIDDVITDELTGDQIARVRSGVFGWANSAANPVVAADLFGKVFVEDDTTVDNDGGVNNVVAGIAIAIETLPDGTELVHVDTRLNLYRANL